MQAKFSENQNLPPYEKVSYKRVLILGGTGWLGSRIAKALLMKKESEVVMMAREGCDKKKPEICDELRKLGAKWVFGDMMVKEDLYRCSEGCDAIISAVNGQELWEGQLNMLEVAKERKIQRIIPSEFGFDLQKVGKGVYPLFDTKINIKDKLIAMGFNWTCISTSWYLQMVTHRAQGFDIGNRRAILPGDGNVVFTLMDMDDVGKLTAEVLYDKRTFGEYLEVAGDRLTYNQLVQVFEEEASKKEKKPVTFQKEYVTNDQIMKNVSSTKDLGELFPWVARMLIMQGKGDNARAINTKLYPNLKYKTARMYAQEYYGTSQPQTF